jgi:hypothetical protein
MNRIAREKENAVNFILKYGLMCLKMKNLTIKPIIILT